jgi:group I intron endonuclease
MITIYLIINKINHKMYVGQTSQTVLRRWNKHCQPSNRCPYLRNAIQKYGENNFIILSISPNVTSREDANHLELYYMDFFDTIKSGYNLSRRGYVTPPPNNIVLNKMGSCRRGKHYPNMHKPHPKMKAAWVMRKARGDKIVSHCIPHTEEAKIRMSISQMQRYAKTNPWEMPRWAGEEASQSAFSKFLSKKFGTPDHCENICCTYPHPKRFVWINISGEIGKRNRDLKHWKMLCDSCGKKFHVGGYKIAFH